MGTVCPASSSKRLASAALFRASPVTVVIPSTSIEVTVAMQRDRTVDVAANVGVKQ